MRALLVLLILLPAASANAEEFSGAVVRVVDGDSLMVKFHGQQVRVRLKEIDAPELKQPFGKDARQSLAQMCAKKIARVSWTEFDRNGRTLGRVWCGEIDTNAEQVRRGMAWIFDRYVTDQALYRLQDAARRERLGLWSDLGSIPLGNGDKQKAHWNTARGNSLANLKPCPACGKQRRANEIRVRLALAHHGEIDMSRTRRSAMPPARRLAGLLRNQP